MDSRQWLPRILWIDGLSALIGGLFVLSLRTFLADFYALPLRLITVIGLVNMIYATFGLWLASRTDRSIGLVTTLALANHSWAVVCVSLVLAFTREAHAIGLAHILFEGAYVATLGTVEWRNRFALAGASPPPGAS